MQYRNLVSGGLKISEIGFGCGGNAGLMVRGEEAEQTLAVARALELGVNYFDNSPDYGNCIAESNLGRALKTLKARPLVNTKVEIRAQNLEDVAAHVVQSAESSLHRLGIDCIDVFQIHNGPTSKPIKLLDKDYRQLPLNHYFSAKGAIEGLARLKVSGKIRCAGFICRGGDGTEVRQLIDTNVFGLINAPYTLLNPSAGRVPEDVQFSSDFGGVIEYARERRIGVAVYSPLAGGFLSDVGVAGVAAHAYSRPQKENESAIRNRAKAAVMRSFAEEMGISLAQAAYQFILTNLGVTSALGGFSSIAQMEEIVAVSGTGLFSTAMMMRVEEIWRANFGLAR